VSRNISLTRQGFFCAIAHWRTAPRQREALSDTAKRPRPEAPYRNRGSLAQRSIPPLFRRAPADSPAGAP